MFENAIANRAAVARLQHDRIAGFHIAQHGELGVAMRGDHTVADAIRHRGSVYVTGTERHRAAARAVQDDVAFSLARKFDSGNRPGIGPSPRLYVPFAVERS